MELVDGPAHKNKVCGPCKAGDCDKKKVWKWEDKNGMISTGEYIDKSPRVLYSAPSAGSTTAKMPWREGRFRPRGSTMEDVHGDEKTSQKKRSFWGFLDDVFDVLNFAATFIPYDEKLLPPIPMNTDEVQDLAGLDG